MDDPAEVVGDVAERGHETELTEAGEECGECHADYGAIGPGKEPKRRRDAGHGAWVGLRHHQDCG